MLHRVTKAAHPPAWSNHGYVCLACRRQWQRSQRIQQRWSSELSQNSSNGREASGENWFDTLNDISDNYSSFTPGPEKPKQEKEKKQDEQKPKAASRKASSMADLVNDLSDELVDGNQDGRLAHPASWRPARQAKERAMAEKTGGSSLDMLKDQLQRMSGSAEGKTYSESAANIQEMARKGNRSLNYYISRQAASKPNTSAEATHDPAERAISNDLDDLIASLGVSTEQKAIEQDAQLGGQQEQEAELESTELREPEVVPFPSFKGQGRDFVAGGAVDNVSVPAGKTKQDETATEAVPKVWKAKTSPGLSGLGGRIPDDTPSSAWRSREADRRSRWGDLEDKSSRSSSKRVTFDTLTKADHVSPKKDIPSSRNTAPFGMAPAPKNETSTRPGAVNATESAPQPPSKGHLMNLLSGLKNRLTGPWGLSASKPVSEDAVKPAPDIADETKQDDAAMKPEQPEHSASQALSKLHSELQQQQVEEPSLAPESTLKSTPPPATPAEPSEAVHVPVSEVSERDSEDHKRSSRIFELEANTKQSQLVRKYASDNTSNILYRLPGDQENQRSYATHEVGGDTQLRPRGLNRRQRRLARQSRTRAAAEAKVASSQQHETSDVPQPEKEIEEAEEPQGMSIAEAMRGGKRAGSKRAGIPASVEPPEEIVEAEDQEAGSEVNASEEIHTMELSELAITPLDIPQPPVPYLEYGLDRVLFNPGVYQLKDPSSRVYNFDPYLEKIMPATEFDFNALKEYKTSSQDKALSAIAQKEDKRYIGSTSSMTSTLAHFHYLISNWRPLNHEMISRGFAKDPTKQVTKINKAPNSIFLRWKNGSYAIDADKEYDSPNVLMLLGKSMELLLTLPTDEYEKYRKSDPRQVSEESKTAPEAYQYTTMGDFLMRSQLDAYDPRLPGNGTFDLKTRAVVSVRMRAWDHEDMTGYEIYGLQGRYGSYEREFYDMTRSTMLKYMLQARMGRMNGIFVAYHNVERIFGFQYVPISEMDRVLHGQTDACLGDQEFKASLKMLNDVLDKATAKFPEQSLRIHFETQEPKKTGEDTAITAMHVFAEPMTEDEIDTIQSKSKDKIQEYERTIMGKDADETTPATTSEESIPDDAEEIVEAAGSANVVDEQAAAPKDGQSSSSEQPASDADDEATATIREALDTKTNNPSSESNADSPFLNTIEKEENSDLRPLFYATIICQSEVNGDVPQDRPTKLTKDDKWDIKYLLKEYENSRNAWAKYEDCKARRKFAFDHDAEEEDAGDPESEAKAQKSEQYIRFLKGMSDKGRQIRSKIDELEAGKEIVRVESPLPRHRESVDSLEDYMQWMYREK
ncbi:mRNA degradation protein, mitochondrial [Pseudocercospora fuligena]|uniref:mRNA degradation protein, mitochondrial n=1 Tax=Pseudocercospora fuligena TaxID=685502 RepID=A0A8H6RKN3_9PEZI|nr:mRNA degradation protein, mitochondrial [Pseudocercospora fuligena]